MLTEVLVAGPALRAGAVGFVKGDGHSIAHLDGVNVPPDFLDHAAHLMAGICGQLEFKPDPFQVLIPEVPVAAADSACLHSYHRSIGPRLLNRDLDDLDRMSEFSNLRRTHRTRYGDIGLSCDIIAHDFASYIFASVIVYDQTTL